MTYSSVPGSASLPFSARHRSAAAFAKHVRVRASSHPSDSGSHAFSRGNPHPHGHSDASCTVNATASRRSPSDHEPGRDPARIVECGTPQSRAVRSSATTVGNRERTRARKGR